jgi:hypothetical protein
VCNVKQQRQFINDDDDVLGKISIISFKTSTHSFLKVGGTKVVVV